MKQSCQGVFSITDTKRTSGSIAVSVSSCLQRSTHPLCKNGAVRLCLPNDHNGQLPDSLDSAKLFAPSAATPRFCLWSEAAQSGCFIDSGSGRNKMANSDPLEKPVNWS